MYLTITIYYFFCFLLLLQWRPNDSWIKSYSLKFTYQHSPFLPSFPRNDPYSFAVVLEQKVSSITAWNSTLWQHLTVPQAHGPVELCWVLHSGSPKAEIKGSASLGSWRRTWEQSTLKLLQVVSQVQLFEGRDSEALASLLAAGQGWNSAPSGPHMPCHMASQSSSLAVKSFPCLNLSALFCY